MPEKPDTLSATAKVISNFALQHLKAATLFRDHAIAIEEANKGQPIGSFFEEIRAYAAGCTMSAAASLEALISELFMAPRLRLRSMLGNFEVEYWGRGKRKGIESMATLKKYKKALDMLGAPPFVETAAPYANAFALIELRNALVHYKPTWDPHRQRKVDLIQMLQGLYQTSPFVPGAADFVSEQSMSADCTRWIVRSTTAFMRDFDDRTHLDDNKMSGFWRLAYAP